MRIVIVDDEAPARERLKRLLDDIDTSLAGDMIEVIYGGKRRPGVIRHITERSGGYHVGVHWTATKLE